MQTSLRLLQTVSAYLPRTVLLERAQDPDLPRVRGRFVEGAVLFADISGFTALSERLSQLGRAGAEEVTAILNRCFTSLLDVLFAHGGDVLKFGGDALTAFFPGDQRQAAAAAQAALRMQEAMRAFREVQTSVGTFRLEMHAGVHWGRAFLAEVGSEDRMEDVFTGGVVNRTAEAEGAAGAGEVAVPAETFALLSEGFEGEAVGDGFYRVCGQRQEAAICLDEFPALDLHALEGAGGVALLKPYLVEGLYEKLLVHSNEIEGEHRRVTVLFIHAWGIDYEGDPDAAEKLDRYVTLVEEVAHRYGGVLNKVDMYTKGDKLMVLFGAPAAHENDEERALRCALDIRAEGARLGFELHHRFGVNAGHVFAGIVGSPLRKEYTVMGDAVNLAARLMGMAEEGQVVLSEAVRARAADPFELRFLGERPVKGKKAPVPVYEAVALAGREAPREETGRLIGREREMEQLRAVAGRALSGAGQVLTLVGEAGVGKSRLAEALADHCRAQGVAVFRGQCPSYGAIIPYFPWDEILRAFFDLPKEERAEVQRERLLRGLAASEAHLVPYAPLLGEIFGISLPDTPLTAALEPEQRKSRLFEVILELVRCRAGRTPLVLLFEDAHWMDDLSWELLDHAARTLLPLPLLMVVVSRPDPRLEAWGSLDCATDVPLAELPEEEARGLIASLLPLREVPPALSDLILTRSQGNPLFIDEIIQVLIQTGVVRADGGGVGDLSSVGLPDTIQGVIMTRIDHLDEGSRSVIKVASVLGRQFRRSFLRGIYPYEVDDPEMQGRLERLFDLGLLQVEEEGADSSYLFKHVLIQEVAYDSLPFARRKVLHHEAGRYIEAAFPDTLEEHCEFLAYHYNRTDDDEKALGYLMRAGVKTKRLYANKTAIGFYTDALRRLEQQEGDGEKARMAIECRSTLGDILKLVGRYPEALGHYEAGLSLSGQIEDRLRQARALQGIGQLRGRMGQYAEALGCHTRALSLVAEAGGDPALEGGLLNDVGTNHFRLGDYRTALGYFERSRSIRRELGDRRRQAFCEMNMGAAYGLLGDPSRAVELLEHAFEVFQKVGDREMETRVLANLSDVRMDSGDYRGAEEACLKAVEILKEIGDRQAELMMLDRLGGINARLGAYPEALAHFQQALALSREVGEAIVETITLNNIGQAHWQLGNYRQAFEVCQTALERARGCGARDTEATALHTLGLIAGSLGDASAALGRFQEAERIAGEVQNSALQSQIRVDLGRRLLSDGKGEAAARGISDALKAARQAGHREVELYGLVSLAVAHLHLGDLRQARALIAEAKRQNATVQHKETEVQTLKLEAEIAGREGRYSEAMDDYNAVFKLTRTLGIRREEGWILLGMGKALRRIGDDERAIAHQQEAIRISVETGDRPLQKKLLTDLLDFERDLGLRGARRGRKAARHRDKVREGIQQLRQAMRQTDMV